MDLRNLKVFVEAAELGSFTRAGQSLGYSQPTVSFQIRQLEQELGVPLFERIGHTISLTQEGRFALGYAQQILRSCQEMVQGADQSSAASGTVRLATADSLCTALIAQPFRAFRSQFPQVSLQLRTAGTPELFRLLDHNEVDLLCTLDRHMYDTAYVTASEERIPVHFVAAVSHPMARRREIRLSELMGEAFLLTEKDMSYCRMLHERLAKENLEIHPVLESGNADLLCTLAQQNLGISFLPDFVTEQAVREGRLCRLDVADLEIELWKQVIYRKEKWMSAPLCAAVSYLSAICLSRSGGEEPGCGSFDNRTGKC